MSIIILDLLLLALFHVTSAALSPLISTNRWEQEPLTTHNGVFRDLREDDIPVLTSLIIAAFSPGPVYHYISPDLPSHEEELWYCMNASITQSWASRNRSSTFAKVIAVEDVPVSVAVWNLRSDEGNQEFVYHLESLNCSTLPGMNTTRASDFERQMAVIEKEYFSTAYPQQLYLNILATHPSWDGHGFAARLVNWGKDISRELADKAWTVTLLATPAGFPLYDSLGFDSVANVTISMLERVNGMDNLWFEVMRWQGS